MFFMTLRDLRFRARRVGLVTLLVALVLTLLYLMIGLTNQLKTEPYDAVDGLGASTWVLAEGVGGPFTAASVLPLTARDELAARAQGEVEPLVVARGTLTSPPGDSTELEIQMIGYQLGRLGQPTLVDGVAVERAGEIVVDDSLGVSVGAVVEIGVERFDVVGVTTDSSVLAGQAFVFVDLETAQRIAFNNGDVVTAFISDGSITPTPGYAIVSADSVAEETLGPIESAVASIDLIRILLWFVAAIVMGAVIYLTALERHRDFAVLKAVGASGRSLGMGLAFQAAVIALAAAAVGAVLAKLIEPAFPLPVKIPSSALVTVPLLAIGVGLLSAIAGVRRVNHTDPAEAFS
jgi:putative ABC transport system permease protein